MKIVTISDQHGYLPEIPPCHLLLIAGDICPDFIHGPISSKPLGTRNQQQADWLDSEFRTWLWNQPAAKIVGIAGNHDFVFDKGKDLVPADLPWTYLEDSGTTVNKLKIYGTPWVPNLPNWAFHQREENLELCFELIPDDTDILITHGPPRGTGDKVLHGNHVGSKALAARLENLYRPPVNDWGDLHPKLHIFGHIHEAPGLWEKDGRITCNTTIVDENYDLVHEPRVFETLTW